jgi:hypothetical protein
MRAALPCSTSSMSIASAAPRSGTGSDP